MTVHDLPAVNATLNALSGVLLLIGYVLIRRRRIAQHRAVMIAAFITSSLNCHKGTRFRLGCE